MEGLVMTGQLLLGLSILVLLHEWGHYYAAKTFGIKVNKFYLFFNFLFPLPNVLNFALWKKKIGDTEYGLGWFPLGGYVDIDGMIDENKDASQLASTPQPWEFRSKPAWQRLTVMLGGIIVNVILGVLIFTVLTYRNGEEYLANKDVTGIVASKLGQEIGLKTGDKIVSINGQAIENFSEISKSLLSSNVNFTVERAGKEMQIFVPNDLMDKLSDKKNAKQLVEPMTPFEVGDVSKTLESKSLIEKIKELFGGTARELPLSPAFAMGLKTGDKIVMANQTPIRYFHELATELEKNAGKTMAITYLRNGQQFTAQTIPTKDGKLGFIRNPLLKTSHLSHGLGESIVVGTQKAFGVISDQLMAFGKIFRGEINPSKALGSFITIGKVYGPVWDWDHFWYMTGMLSMVLAFMNLLPIPALDGGHAVLLLYEMISGRKPSEKFQEVTQQIGMVLLLALMIFAIGNDIFRNFF